MGKISQKKSSRLSLRAGDETSNVHMDTLSKTNSDYYFGLLKMEFDQYDFYSHRESIDIIWTKQVFPLNLGLRR